MEKSIFHWLIFPYLNIHHHLSVIHIKYTIEDINNSSYKYVFKQKHMWLHVQLHFLFSEKILAYLLQSWPFKYHSIHTVFPIFLKDECVSHSVISHSSWSYGLKPTRLLSPWNSPWTRTLEWVTISSSRRELPGSWIKHWSLALQADSLPSESPRKPFLKYTLL